jgi:hypothetical protein
VGLPGLWGFTVDEVRETVFAAGGLKGAAFFLAVAFAEAGLAAGFFSGGAIFPATAFLAAGFAGAGLAAFFFAAGAVFPVSGFLAIFFKPDIREGLRAALEATRFL